MGPFCGNSSETVPTVLKNNSIPLNNQIWGPTLPPALCYIWPDKKGDFLNLVSCSEILGMTFEGLGEIFKGDFADMFTMVSIGAEQRVKHVQNWERGPPSASANFLNTKIVILKLIICLQPFLDPDNLKILVSGKELSVVILVQFDQFIC
jgi:hypothetical protein